jgi:CDP-glucose 4,6-dehydratase
MTASDLGVLNGKRILVTGHTGFKGTWLTIWLCALGAKVTGFALEPEYPDGVFARSGIQRSVRHIVGDIRDTATLHNAFEAARPDAVLHLAAQPLVLRSYRDPRATYETNVMGTLNVLEEIRASEHCRAGILITSDKCYENNEWVYGYRETDRIGGSDIYSSSKGCAELLVHAYRHTYLPVERYEKHGKLLVTTRAGNVLGGGDWAENRIVPDCIRALNAGETIMLRRPQAVRPWQHVLDPLAGYLLLASKALEGDVSVSGAWNFGPDADSLISVESLVQKIIAVWGSGNYVCDESGSTVPESGLLSLDSSKARQYLGWRPVWGLNDTVKKTVEWYKNNASSDALALCLSQIRDYLDG